MKLVSALLFLLALAAGAALVCWTLSPAPDAGGPLAGPDARAFGDSGRALVDPPRGATPSAIDPTAEVVARLDKVIARLEQLESSFSEVRTEIRIRSEERTRVPVAPASATGPRELSESDLELLRTLLHDAQLAELWRLRQQELVDLGRRFSHALPIESRHVDPMIEVLCAGGLALFNLDSELLDSNHDRTLSRRRAPELRIARRRLREDLGSVVKNDDAAARLFLGAVCATDEDLLSMEVARVQALEKEWLK